MCVTIFFEDSEEEISSPKQLESTFGISPQPRAARGYHSVRPDACLCQIDVEKYLTDAGVKFEYDGYDFTVKNDSTLQYKSPV